MLLMLTPKKMRAFRLDPKLDEEFSSACRNSGLVLERVMEALVFRFAIEGTPPPEEIMGLIQKVNAWRDKQPKSVVGHGPAVIKTNPPKGTLTGKLSV